MKTCIHGKTSPYGLCEHEPVMPWDTRNLVGTCEFEHWEGPGSHWEQPNCVNWKPNEEA